MAEPSIDRSGLGEDVLTSSVCGLVFPVTEIAINLYLNSNYRKLIEDYSWLDKMC